MPILKPTIDLIPELAIDTTEILQEAGLVPNTKSASDKKSEISKYLDDDGMGRADCSRRISDIAYHADDQKLQLQATILALKLHGDLDRKDRDTGKVQINFIGATPEMLNILIPR